MSIRRHAGSGAVSLSQVVRSFGSQSTTGLRSASRAPFQPVRLDLELAGSAPISSGCRSRSRDGNDHEAGEGVCRARIVLPPGPSAYRALVPGPDPCRVTCQRRAMPSCQAVRPRLCPRSRRAAQASPRRFQTACLSAPGPSPGGDIRVSDIAAERRSLRAWIRGSAGLADHHEP